MTNNNLLNSSIRILLTEGPLSLIRQAREYIKYTSKLRSSYQVYLNLNKITDIDLENMQMQICSFKFAPRISVITPVYNVDNIWLDKAISSVINQIYENWELCLVDDAST